MRWQEVAAIYLMFNGWMFVCGLLVWLAPGKPYGWRP